MLCISDPINTRLKLSKFNNLLVRPHLVSGRNFAIQSYFAIQSVKIALPIDGAEKIQNKLYTYCMLPSPGLTATQ